MGMILGGRIILVRVYRIVIKLVFIFQKSGKMGKAKGIRRKSSLDLSGAGGNQLGEFFQWHGTVHGSVKLSVDSAPYPSQSSFLTLLSDIRLDSEAGSTSC